MFTLQQIKAAHAKVKSGIDFPAYVQEIKQLGLLHYDFLVKNGQTEYYGENGFKISSDPVYPEQAISDNPSAAEVKNIIAEHQQGKTSFLTFCQQVAEAGVNKWVVDTVGLMCTYYDVNGNSMIAEPIPDVDY